MRGRERVLSRHVLLTILEAFQASPGFRKVSLTLWGISRSVAESLGFDIPRCPSWSCTLSSPWPRDFRGVFPRFGAILNEWAQGERLVLRLTGKRRHVLRGPGALAEHLRDTWGLVEDTSLCVSLRLLGQGLAAIVWTHIGKQNKADRLGHCCSPAVGVFRQSSGGKAR